MRLTWAVWVAVCLCCLTGCGSRKTPADSRVLNMGERVQVGPLIYIVSEANWLDQLGEAASLRMPHDRFFTIRLSVTNSGSRTVSIPATELLAEGGQSYPELTDAQGLPEWLGYLRMLKPAETDHGLVAFDVPPGAYRLRVSSDADPENQRSMLVNIPFQLPSALPSR